MAPETQQPLHNVCDWPQQQAVINHRINSNEERSIYNRKTLEAQREQITKMDKDQAVSKAKHSLAGALLGSIPGIIAAIWVIVKMTATVTCIAFPIFLFGCGPGSTETIVEKAVEATEEVKATIDNLETIIDASESSEERFEVHGDAEGIAEQQLIQSEATDGVGHQKSIAEDAKEIIIETANVQDKAIFFDRLLSTLGVWAWVVGGIVAAWLLWQTGLGYLFKRLIAWPLGLMIPKGAMNQASIDMKVADTNDPMTPREAIGIRRSGDPAYDAARKKLSKWR